MILLINTLTSKKSKISTQKLLVPKKVILTLSVFFIIAQIIIAGFLFYFSLNETLADNTSWYNSNWHHRKPITINNTTNSNNLTNHQIEITLGSSNFSFSHAESDGKDLRFTNSDGTTLLDYWIENYNNSSRTATIWVNVPSVPAVSNKIIYLYYGNSSASRVSNFDNTFAKNYEESGLVGRWHLDNGSGSTISDSSNNSNNGTNHGGSWQQNDGGQWNGRSNVRFSSGSALQFDGDNDYLYLDNNGFSTSTGAIEMWVKPTSATSSTQTIFETRKPTTNDSGTFMYPRGVAVDSEGNVYVADDYYHRIQKFDSNGNFLMQFGGTQGSGDGEFCGHGPFDLGVDSQGNIYVADTYNDRVQKFGAQGNFIKSWGSTGSADGKMNRVQGIFVDSYDNIWIADSSNTRIQKFDSDGNFIMNFGSSGDGNGEFSNPTDLVIDSSNNIYVADIGNYRIQKFDSNGNFITRWGSEGSGQGEFNQLRAIGIDNNDNIYATDRNGNARVQKFDSDGNFLLSWGSKGAANGEFDRPHYVAAYSSDYVYVSDSLNHRIEKFDTDGNFITKWGVAGVKNGQFYLPYDNTTDSFNNLYVSDWGNNRIQKFDSNGNFITKWGSEGTSNGEFDQPLGVTTDSSDNIYVADSNNNRIQKFDSDGNFITKWGSYGTSTTQFITPKGICSDSNNNIYVVDSANHRVQKFDSSGTFIASWGSGPASSNGSFNTPFDCTADSSDNIYVSDMNNYRIQKFDSDGNFITKWGSEGTGNNQFTKPTGLTINSSNQIYIADITTEGYGTRYFKYLKKFDTNGNFLDKYSYVGFMYYGSRSSYSFAGLATDSNDNIYLTGVLHQRVKKIDSAGNELFEFGDSWLKVILRNNKFHVGNFSRNYQQTWVSSNSISYDQWHHLAINYNNSNISLYVNGSLSETKSIDTPLVLVDNLINIARDGLSEQGYFKGVVDEIRVYNQTLPGQEITSHYQRRKYTSPEPTTTLGEEKNRPAGIGLSPVAFTNPTPPPSTPQNPKGEFKVLINNGNEYTTTPKANLKLWGGNNTERMAISNDSSFSPSASTGQISYRLNYNWNICQGKKKCFPQKHTVYVKFFTKYGRASKVVSDSIILKKSNSDIEIENKKNTTKKDSQKNKKSAQNPLEKLPSIFISKKLDLNFRGKQVVKLQNHLKELGFLPEKITSSGYFGTATNQAVKNYQKFVDIYPCGIVGPRTRKSLRGKEFITNKDYRFTKTLKYNDTGKEVKQLQTRLRNQSFFPYWIKSTGWYGPITEKSLKIFQKVYNLTPTGIVNKLTREILNKFLSQ